MCVCVCVCVRAYMLYCYIYYPCGSVVKNLLQSRRCEFDPWVRNIPWSLAKELNPLQYSCLGNPVDRGTWWAVIHVITKSQTRLSKQRQIYVMYTCVYMYVYREKRFIFL